MVVLMEKYSGIDICLGYEDDYNLITAAVDKEESPFILQAIIAQGMTVAQIIFEKIIHPDVYEVPQLAVTVRGSGGFGSIDDGASSSNPEPHTTKYKPNWDILLPKEKQIILHLLKMRPSYGIYRRI
ncbi:hypothetical protein ZIOFF_000504 [Zingiber officinale]|uniref:Deoxyuridine 5'-triphosphate nucleotidohydrolase n=1 Tax=Zingiber officinale TaxID=94328 RepID=A0A8J5IHT9_ZINOF|nr:hypothetical protein ZIOFF_000504 [Zingiber officinale]